MNKKSQKIILVTGGAGFVGSHLCEHLVKDLPAGKAGGHKVISLDNYFTGSKDNHVDGVEYIEGHTKDIKTLIKEKPDVIYHLGEYSRVEQSLLEPNIVHDFNIVGTLGVVEFWKKHKCKLIYAGSSTKFGDGGRARETTPYAKTKAGNTELVKRVGEENELPYAVTYFYNVYGPRERADIYGTVIEMFKQMYVNGTPIAVTDPGTQTRNFTHVDDIVNGLILVGEKGHGDEYGLGNEESFPIIKVAEMFGGNVVMFPERVGNRMESSIDTSKTRGLGWKTEKTLEEYVREFTDAVEPKTVYEKKVLVFSTTFFPTIGPAEEALIALMEKIPDVHFDIVTSRFSRKLKDVHTLSNNVRVYRMGVGNKLDKFLLPILGFMKARKLQSENSYLFAWSLMASYAALAGVLFKLTMKLPLLITLADQNLDTSSRFIRFFLKKILSNADQVYSTSVSQEEGATQLVARPLRQSMGDKDVFANQLRYAYAEILLNQQKVV